MKLTRQKLRKQKRLRRQINIAINDTIKRMAKGG